MVRTMKSQNGALALFVSRVVLSDVGKIQLKPDSLLLLSKPVSEDGKGNCPEMYLTRAAESWKSPLCLCTEKGKGEAYQVLRFLLL